MTTDDADVAWVQVEQVEVGITLADVVNALAAEARNMIQQPPTLAAGASGAPTVAAPTDQNAELAQLLQQMHDLSNQLAAVIARIDQIDPTVLAGVEADGGTT